MSIAEHIYQIAGELMIIIVMLLIAHYVFLEPKWQKWQQMANLICTPVLVLIEFLVESEDKILVSLLLVGLNISLARKKHRIRGFFLIIPILGICLGLWQFEICLPELLFGIADEKYSFLIDCATILLLLLFLWKGKKWREQFELEMQYRRLQKWESRLLIGVGLLVYGVSFPLLDGGQMAGMDDFMKRYAALVTFITLVLTVTVIVLVMQGNQRAYYKGIAELNERYLRAELKHFQTYQDNQIETRRIRHDMKNHLQSIMHLANENDLDEIRNYLEKLNVSVGRTDMELHCGNSIADAICNEKNQYAKKKEIHFEIEGRMPDAAQLEAIDICTIFSNALDNAIEAVTLIPDVQKRWINLKIQNQGEILFLQFTNPMLEHENKGMKTTKKDSINHGFGLQNIRMAVEKYQGSMAARVEKTENGAIFVLELMLMNQSQQN